MDDIYKTPEAELSTEPERRITYDIPAIKRYRWLMVCSLAVAYFSRQVIVVASLDHEGLLATIQIAAFLINMIFFAVLAAKVYQKVWVVVLCVVLSFIPVANLIACLFMNIKAREIINYWGRPRYTFR